MRLLSRLFSRSGDDRLDQLLGEASRDPASRTRFYRALLDARIWVPGEEEGGSTYLRPYTVEGRRALLLFTSPAMASGLRDRPSLLHAASRPMLQTGLSFESVVLNYGNRNEKWFTPSEIRAILDGTIFDVASTDEGEGTTIVGQPKEYPVRLMNELVRALPTRADIDAAYLAQTTRPGNEPQIVIALDTTMSEVEFQEVAAKLYGLAGSLGASHILFTRLQPDPLGEYLRLETKPFYRRDG